MTMRFVTLSLILVAASMAVARGSFGYWVAGTRHFAWSEGETILQLHRQGPWTITYVNPADDPRR